MENNLLIYAGCEEEKTPNALLGFRGLELGKWVIDSTMLEEMFRSPRIIIPQGITWYV